MTKKRLGVKVAIAALVAPLLLGCGCCEAPWAVFDSVFGDDRPHISEDQVPGVWQSDCGGKISFRDDGVYVADGLMFGEPQQPLSHTGKWHLTDNDRGGQGQLVRLEGLDPEPILEVAAQDPFEGFEYDARDQVPGAEPLMCQVRRAK
ncbi:hypothetical protein [Dactylosporangium darangshiense]|uniref:Lipoprotein n=1 Tax=Dactylosporangium darangshiense TaxID=579108 RepID=A0ABP8DDI3_9ACTN